jgi:hypothetical protein
LWKILIKMTNMLLLQSYYDNIEKLGENHVFKTNLEKHC